MTTKTESGKTETGKAGKLEISKETLRDLTEREPSSGDEGRSAQSDE